MTLPAKLTIAAAIFMVASFVWGLVGTFWFAVGTALLIFAALFAGAFVLARRADDASDQLAHDLADDAWLTAATNSALSGKLPHATKLQARRGGARPFNHGRGE